MNITLIPWWMWLGLFCGVGLLFLLFSPLLVIWLFKPKAEKPSVHILKTYRGRVYEDLQCVTEGRPIDMDRYNNLKDMEMWINAKLAMLERP